MSKNERSRIWSIVLYPEHCSREEAVDILNGQTDMVLFSPLHSPDPVNDKELKPHYHITFFYSNARERASIEPWRQLFHSPTAECITGSRANWCRYQVHMDSPDKEQFQEPYDVVLINSTCSFTSLCNNRVEAEYFTELCNIVRDSGLTVYADVFDLIISEYPQYAPLFAKRSNHFFNYLKSRAWSNSRPQN